MRRETPFADIVRYLTPFFVSRQVVARGGSAADRTARAWGSKVSQRADFFEVEVGLETTLKRLIIKIATSRTRAPTVSRRRTK